MKLLCACYNWVLFILEYANANKLQQDHPCVIRLIRRNYLLQPAPKNLSYRLDHPGSPDPSDGQSQAILEILQNKVCKAFEVLVSKKNYDSYRNCAAY